jgi:hypothetical protein
MTGLQIGDVVCVTKLMDSTSGFGTDVLRGKTYGMINLIYAGDGEYGVHWLFTRYDVGLSSAVDEFEYVPPEKWPPRVCKRMMLRALEGGMND